MDLNGASALVTGGASGIGAATSAALAARGATCMIVDRDEERGARQAASLGGLFCRADVGAEDEILGAVEAAAEFGPLRAVVNAAGIGSAARTVDRDGSPMPMADFERVVRVNLLGTFNCLRLAAARIAATEPYADDGARGSILNIASVAAFDGQIGQAAYAASKAAIVGMTLPIARDLAAAGVRVNTIAPGLIDTPIYGRSARAAAFKAKLGENVLFPRRLGTPDELAAMAIAVLTNDYVNGETIRVDGGLRMPAR